MTCDDNNPVSTTPNNVYTLLKVSIFFSAWYAVALEKKNKKKKNDSPSGVFIVTSQRFLCDRVSLAATTTASSVCWTWLRGLAPTSPSRREDTTLPQGSLLHQLPQEHANIERATGKVEATCESYSTGKAEAFCWQCAMFICAKCVEQHRMTRAFAGHKINLGGAEGGMQRMQKSLS